MHSINFLERLIGLEQIEVSSYTIITTCNLRPPTKVTKFQSLVDPYSVIQKFVPDSRKITEPLGNKRRKGKPMNCQTLPKDDSQVKTTMQKKLLSSPFFTLPHGNVNYNIYIYTFAEQVGHFLPNDSRANMTNLLSTG